MKKKLARIIRFVEPGVLAPKQATSYDKDKNLMLVDRWMFEHVNEHLQTGMLFANNDTYVE